MRRRPQSSIVVKRGRAAMRCMRLARIARMFSALPKTTEA
jgi:hypothetical protein